MKLSLNKIRSCCFYKVSFQISFVRAVSNLRTTTDDIAVAGQVPPVDLDVNINADNQSSFNFSQETTEKDPSDEFLHLKDHPYKSLYPWKSKKELGQFLCDNIVYSEDGLIAFNKPFGVGVLNLNLNATEKEKATHPLTPKLGKLHIRGIGESPYTLQDAVPFIKKELNLPNLKLLKSTEKFSSGVAVFASEEKYALKYQYALRVSKPAPIFNFTIVSTNIPILLPENKIQERVAIQQQSHPMTDLKQPIITRKFAKNAMENQTVYVVHTSMSMLSRNALNTALLELKTSSTKWNFLRIYSTDMLAPILGDQLFAGRVQFVKGVAVKVHPVHLVPGTNYQKLRTELLETLRLKNAKDSLIIPTHIHLSSLNLKGYPTKHKQLCITAPLPKYFQWTCDTLGLTRYNENDATHL